MKTITTLVTFVLLFASGQQVLHSQQPNPPEKKGKAGFERPDKNYNDYLFKKVDGQSIRVKGRKTLFFNGDSIMSGLASSFKGKLDGKVNALYRKDIQRLIPNVEHEVSCTAAGLLDFMRAYIDHPDFQIDVMMVNAGIHDALGGTPPETYGANLECLIELAQSHGIPLIWVNTIPTTDQINKHPRFRIIKSRIDPLNAEAAVVMNKHDIPIIDLNNFMRKLIDAEGVEAVYRDPYHQKPEFAMKQAEFVAGEVLRILKDDELLKKQLPEK